MLNNQITLNGFRFKLNDQDPNDSFYECRGEMYYDDYHDEMPEPTLWSAAGQLAKQLSNETGEDWIRTHSEKGWVEIQKNRW